MKTRVKMFRGVEMPNKYRKNISFFMFICHELKIDTLTKVTNDFLLDCIEVIKKKKLFLIVFVVSTLISSFIASSFARWYIDELNKPLKSPVPDNWMELKPLSVGKVGAVDKFWIGEASWYGTGEGECLGCSKNRTMANGQRLDDSKFTVACGLKSSCAYLKMGDRIIITNLKNSKQVEAVVTDRGGLRDGRIIDVSKAVRNSLGFTSLTQVKVVKK